MVGKSQPTKLATYDYIRKLIVISYLGALLKTRTDIPPIATLNLASVFTALERFENEGVILKKASNAFLPHCAGGFKKSNDYWFVLYLCFKKNSDSEIRRL